VTDSRAPRGAASRDPYQTVLEVGTTLSASLDLDEVTQAIARQVGEALDVQWCDINEYDAEARTMTYVAVWSEQLRQIDLDYLGTVVDVPELPGGAIFWDSVPLVLTTAGGTWKGAIA